MNNEEIYKRIIVMDSIKAANTYMKTCEVTKSDMIKLCKKHDIFIESNATKEQIIARFISSTLGVKLKNKAINKFHTK